MLASPEIISTTNTKAGNGSLVRYEPIDCRKVHDSVFLSKSRNVSLVTTDQNATNNVLGARPTTIRDSDGPIDFTYAWICGDGYCATPSSFKLVNAVCNTSVATNVMLANSWTLFGHGISYCMVEEVL